MHENPVIFEYTDYRIWLREYFRHAQRAGPHRFTQKALAKKLNLSPSVLSRVLNKAASGDDARRLTLDQAERLAEVLTLRPDERLYLFDMVALDSANEGHRPALLARLEAQRDRHQRAYHLADELRQYISTWYMVAVREMVRLRGFRPVAAWIRGCLVAEVSEEDLEHCLRVLPELGLIDVASDGTWSQGEQTDIHLGTEVRIEAAADFHRQILDLASAAIRATPREQRLLLTKTIPTRADRVPELRARLNALVEEFGAEATAEHPDAIYQVHASFFPLAYEVPHEKN